MVQWLRLQASNAGDLGSVPGQSIKISHAVWHSQKLIKKKGKLSFWRWGGRQMQRKQPIAGLLLVRRNGSGSCCNITRGRVEIQS